MFKFRWQGKTYVVLPSADHKKPGPLDGVRWRRLFDRIARPWR